MALFEKILIANRGEIACRIIKTAKKLGIHTVSIFSDADVTALHTKIADEAVYIGPSPSSESYLNPEKIIEVALHTNTQAIHPGYGFLSENGQFANQCEQAGISFIGPSAKSIQLMGEKHVAKDIVAKHYIPVLPDYKGADQTENNLLRQADKIGYPVLIKATAGGGGKGMRIVSSKNAFKDALYSAKREALACFGNDHIFLEKYLENARHIEVQILADKYHNMITLFERDCSIQRRHQKILEEAPAPHISENLRDQLKESALIAARAISYHNVGTVEFLVTENENFYFMEMNTRLQVEHPVTEMITGIDLVEWQIRVAAGEQLPFSQPISTKGHAIEVRICAEEPEKDFIPSIGKIDYFNLPVCEKLRIDTGYVAGDSVSIYYDSLLAKLIVLGENREASLKKLAAAINDVEIVGIATNLKLIQEIINHPDFISAKLSTHFLENNQILSKLKSHDIPEIAILFAGIGQIIINQKLVTDNTHISDCHSPWLQRDFWQLNINPTISLSWLYQNQEFLLEIYLKKKNYEVILNNKKYLIMPVKVNFIDERICQFELKIDEHYETAKLIFHKETTVFYKGKSYNLKKVSTHQQMNLSSIQGHLQAPMPGTIIEILVNQGQAVTKGDKLLVIEAMKMEHTIYAPHSGVITACHFGIGDLIEEGVELLEIKQIGTPL